ncbi:MAG: phosphatidate cytidylyltransferase [Actinomycetota bacterium]|nr:phosphatidate cytidylyltransferase [Actinomycetota bacterium]
MNYLRFKKLLQADNDGTFWPGYIEIPEEVKPKSNIITDKEDNQKIIKNPRIYTGLGLLLVVSLFFLNKNSALILLILVALIATKEWFDLFEFGIVIPFPLLLYASIAPLLVAYFYGFDNFYVPYFVFPLGVVIYTGTFVSYGIYEKFGSSYLFLIWFGTGIGSIGYILSNLENMFTYLVLISVSISDIAAYEFGRRYGKRKLYERISPNKTIEGFLAGLIFGSFILSVVLYNFLSTNFMLAIFLSLIVITFGTLGDLFESRIKRSLDVKDSSTFLPGHGGVLDRIDSQLFSFPALVMLLHFFDLI